MREPEVVEPSMVDQICSEVEIYGEVDDEFLKTVADFSWIGAPILALLLLECKTWDEINEVMRKFRIVNGEHPTSLTIMCPLCKSYVGKVRLCSGCDEYREKVLGEPEDTWGKPQPPFKRYS